jgi:hypothetical protein
MRRSIVLSFPLQLGFPGLGVGMHFWVGVETCFESEVALVALEGEILASLISLSECGEHILELRDASVKAAGG